jgi:heavy metal sensor kinase
MVPVALASAVGGGYLLTRRALEPMDEMVETASMITALHLHRRIPLSHRDDELDRLADTLNHMISRLERSFEEVRRFTADAAHELRTPLAIMRSEAEIALRAPRSPDEYRRVIESMLEETTQLASLAEQLLFLCREDSGLRTGIIEPVALSESLEDLADQMQVAAKEKEITIVSTIMPHCLVNGDPQGLRRLFLNLLDNAIKYTDPGGNVTITCHQSDNWIEIVIEDTGIGIPAEFLPLIFDRFYRVDSSRTPEVKGTGLGLAISRSIVEAHSGTIECSSTPGIGSRFCVRLPAAKTVVDPRGHHTPKPESRLLPQISVTAR